MLGRAISRASCAAPRASRAAPRAAAAARRHASAEVPSYLANAPATEVSTLRNGVRVASEVRRWWRRRRQRQIWRRAQRA
jgi:hypothetical protein